MLIHVCKKCEIKFTKPHNPNRPYSFCSYSCRARYTSDKARLRKTCIECGGKFSVIKYYESQKFCSTKCRDKHRDLGKTTEAFRIRTSKKYKLWREAVMKRDNYTCQDCGKTGGKLNADHIKRFSDYPELRLDLDNGRTLCEPCHRQTPTFGNRRVAINQEA